MVEHAFWQCADLKCHHSFSKFLALLLGATGLQIDPFPAEIIWPI